MSTKTIDVRDVHTSLTDLLAQVATGTEIILTDGQTPRARLVPFQPLPSQRVAGLHLGSMLMSADFDAPLPEDVWPDM